MLNKAHPLVGIEYMGIAGASKECLDAIKRLIQCHYDFRNVLILTCRDGHIGTHCLLIYNSVGDQIAIKSGFSSGYGGGGPSYFSETLTILDSHRIEIDECLVEEALIERIDQSALTRSDLEAIESTRPTRPTRWHDYILDKHERYENTGRIWRGLEPVVPFAIIDERLFDLASTFWDNPDDKLLIGYRRLEDIVRNRTDLTDSGRKLFSKAFNQPGAVLEWKGMDNGEMSGRINLFVGAYGAHRNPRAHKEMKHDSREQLSEFLLLNHLYRLETEATICENVENPDGTTV